MPSSDSISVADPRPMRIPRRRRRRWASALMIVRRTHMVLGLLLMPWALLYGVSGYLFNHPTHFQDANMRAFGAAEFQGTFLEHGLDAEQSARQLVERLNQRFGETQTLVLDRAMPAAFASEFIFASADSDEETVSLLLHRDGSGGTVHTTKKSSKSSIEPVAARFDIASVATKPESTVKVDASSIASIRPIEPMVVEALDRAQVLEAVEVIASRLDSRFADRKFRVTSIPELQVHIRDGEQTWVSRYNAISGAVTSKLANIEPKPLPTWRRFLTRMHTTHGYPLDRNARWVWAIVVDVMSGVLVFLGISGLVMWWQIKRTRPWGSVALVVSIVFAIGLRASMMVGMR